MKGSIYFFLGAFLFAWALNEINVHYIKRINPENEQRNGYSLVEDATIYNIDNLWYLPQVGHILNGRGYTLDPNNPYMSVRRTPGYSLFFSAHHWLFGEKGAYKIVRIAQLLLLSLSVVLFGYTVLNFTASGKMAIVSSLLYGTSLYHIQWLYYTITEAVHPQFLVIALFFLSLHYRLNKNIWSVWCGVFVGLTTLIRPVDGLILPFFILFLLPAKWDQELLKSTKPVVWLMLGFILVMTPWVVRNYKVTNGEFIFLEKYYQEDPMLMGKGHIHFRRWWSAWGQSESELLFGEMVKHSVNDSLSNLWIDKFVLKLPEVAFRGYGQNDLKQALYTLMLCHREKVESSIGFHLPHPIRPVLACDEHSKQLFEGLIAKYRSADPFRYWMITPLISANEYVVQSNSTAWAMLNPAGRTFNFFQWGAKTWMLLLNVVLYASIFLLLFIKMPDWRLKILLAGFPLATLLFFAVFIRYAEVRYMLQAYVFMFFALAYVFTPLMKKIILLRVKA